MVTETPPPAPGSDTQPLDLLIVGAGFGGLCLLHKARQAGLKVLAIEADEAAALASFSGEPVKKKGWFG